MQHYLTLFLHGLGFVIGWVLLLGIVAAGCGLIWAFASLSWMELKPKPKAGRCPLDLELVERLSAQSFALAEKAVAEQKRWPCWSDKRDRPLKPLYRAGLLELVGKGYYGSLDYRLTPEAAEALETVREQRALRLGKRPRRRLSALA